MAPQPEYAYPRSSAPRVAACAYSSPAARASSAPTSSPASPPAAPAPPPPPPPPAGGHEPVVLDALLPSAHAVPPAFSEAPLIHADVRDPAAVTAALRGVDAVCHQAAMVGLGKDFADAPDYVACNDLGTATLLAAMA